MTLSKKAVWLFWPLLPAVLLSGAPPKPLAIVEAAFQQYEDGPAAGSGFVAGETVFFTFRIQGYALSSDDTISLRYQFDAVDPRGIRLAETVQKDIQSSVSPQDKDWLPKASQSVAIPPLAEAGTYKMIVSVSDLTGKTETKAEFPFQVRGRKVEPSEKLVLRNFRFLHQEEDKQPLAAPAYHPGDTVWARFEITGYKTGANNLIDVEYKLAVAGADGAVLFSQPEAAVIKETPFYPNRYEPGVVSLTTNADTHPGTYLLVVTVRDRAGDQTYEAREQFKME